MIAGVVVALPRLGLLRCGGCGRLYRPGALVALDMPGNAWVLACPRCYLASPVGLWPGLPVWWDGDQWLPV